MGGWPSVFYVIGGFSLVWFVLWAVFMYDRPSDHPRISPDEKHYIEKTIGNPSGDDGDV
jgi:ACS family sodium-dependent inorganic phosphate cotransporter-like MFS transporter 5